MSFREDLVRRAIAEWEWFGKGEGRQDHLVHDHRKETVEPFASRVGDYWLAISSADYDRLVTAFAKKKGKLDGTVDLAWSAAFISYCMQTAGAGKLFPYAPGHATWMVKSIANKQQGKLGASIVGYEIGEKALTVGDLVGKTRTASVTYDNAVAEGWFVSHSDIVVEIDLTRKVAHTIGGNVGQTVSKATVDIDANGKMKPAAGWIVHIVNNIVSDPASAFVAALQPADARVG